MIIYVYTIDKYLIGLIMKKKKTKINRNRYMDKKKKEGKKEKVWLIEKKKIGGVGGKKKNMEVERKRV